MIFFQTSSSNARTLLLSQSGGMLAAIIHHHHLSFKLIPTVVPHVSVFLLTRFCQCDVLGEAMVADIIHGGGRSTASVYFRADWSILWTIKPHQEVSGDFSFTDRRLSVFPAMRPWSSQTFTKLMSWSIFPVNADWQKNIWYDYTTLARGHWGTEIWIQEMSLRFI